MLDIKVCEAITSLVEKLSTSGKQEQIDKKLFKELATQAGKSEIYIKFCLEKIFTHLEQNHSEIRLGAFLIIDELFRRSGYFREILLDDFHTFLELTVESNPSKLLPPPLHVAKTLKQKVLQTIHKWYSSFASDHKRLALSYNFLKNNLKIDFQDALKRNAAELRSEQQERDRRTTVIGKKIAAVQEEINDNQDEIVRLVTEMDNCFCLLVPKPENIFSSDLEQSIAPDAENVEINLREHGYQNASTTVTIEINNHLKYIQKTEDNSAIFDNLQDFNALLKNRYLPMIKKWIQISSKSENPTVFRKVMDMKKMVDSEVNRFNLLDVPKRITTGYTGIAEVTSEDDSDFEDVAEKEGFEAESKSSPMAAVSTFSNLTEHRESSQSTSKTWTLTNLNKDDANDPTSLLANLKTRRNNSNEKSSSSKNFNLRTASQKSLTENASETRKNKLLQIAPKLPYDVDLYHWEDKDLKAPSFEIVETDGHKFWTPSGDRAGETIEDPNGIASLRTRVIEFTGSFEPVKWSCRAVLPNGALCPRKDRIKCPFHGKIIARDIIGNPTNPDDAAELEKAKEKEDANKPPEWQDPQFLKEIEAEIGIDLTIKPPKKGKAKKKTFSELYPSLTDIDKKKNTPRSRLEKKVFNKSSMKRVAGKLDEMNYKKHKDKFGDQWNYSMHDS